MFALYGFVGNIRRVRVTRGAFVKGYVVVWQRLVWCDVRQGVLRWGWAPFWYWCGGSAGDGAGDVVVAGWRLTGIWRLCWYVFDLGWGQSCHGGLVYAGWTICYGEGLRRGRVVAGGMEKSI